MCVLEDRGCSHYHVVCVISRLAAAVGRLHRLPCCQHYSLPPSPAITHHTTHTQTHTARRARYMCGCAWPRQNAAELHESIHIHNLHSIELKSNQRIDNWEWWRKKKLFFAHILIRYRDESTAQVRLTDTDSRSVKAYSMNTERDFSEKQINKGWHKSMGGWWQPEMMLLNQNRFNCQKRLIIPEVKEVG